MTCGQSEVAMGNLWILLAAGGVMAAVIGCLTLLNNRYTLNNIKSKTVGDGQQRPTFYIPIWNTPVPAA